MLRFGGPSGLQLVVEGGAFTIFLLLIGKLGENQAAASSIAINVNMVAFVPMVGVGLAVSTLVGQQIGRGKPALAARATWTACILGLIYTAVFVALYVLAPDLLMLGHRMGATDFESVRDLAVILLRFVAAYCLFDALQLIFSHAIKGAGDTRFVFYTTLITSTAFVGIGLAGSRVGGWGILWWWSLITGWILLLCVIYFSRFLQGRWRQMRVIEPEVAVEIDEDVLKPVAMIWPAS
jgi:MATE family multidrug resistance protein